MKVCTWIYVSMDSVMSYQINMDDFEICDIDEYTCSYAFK
jgi:hypothetical protein